MYSPKIQHVADICYLESYLRTPLPLLPFQQPRWMDAPVEKTSVASGVYPADDERADDAVESIEGQDEDVCGAGVWGDGKREWVGWENMRRESTVPQGKGGLKRSLDDDDDDEEGTRQALKKQCKA
ncbi:hypothetical protein ACEQ8H_002153 [Pleosporales sp. CAS-2024a]